jgi:hypothetical protein
MGRFQFRLERVLAWRRTALSLEQARLEALNTQLRGIEAARIDLIRRRQELQRRVATAPSVNGEDLAALDTFRSWAAREEVGLMAKAADLHRAIVAQSAKTVEADRAVRLIERLRERRLEAWTADQERALEELAGESAVAQWRRAQTSRAPETVLLPSVTSPPRLLTS